MDVRILPKKWNSHLKQQPPWSTLPPRPPRPPPAHPSHQKARPCLGFFSKVHLNAIQILKVVWKNIDNICNIFFSKKLLDLSMNLWRLCKDFCKTSLYPWFFSSKFHLNVIQIIKGVWKIMDKICIEQILNFISTLSKF